MVFGEVSVVVSLGAGVTFCGSPMKAFMFEKLRKRLLVAFCRSSIGGSRVCPGLVGGGQGTALTALDHRKEFRRTPNLLSDGDGISGNVGDLGINVFAKGSRESKVKFLGTASDNAHPSRSFTGLRSKCGSIVRGLGLFSLFDGEP